MLAFSGAGKTRRHLAVYAHWVTAGHGILSLGQVIQGEPMEMLERRSAQRDLLRKFIRDEGMTAFATVVAAPKIDQGIFALVQCHGLGGLEPNTVLLGWPEDPGRREVFAHVLRTVAGMRRSMMIVRTRDADEDLWSAPLGTIDVWWRGRDNGVLLLLVAHLLRSNPAWRSRRIRLLRVIPTESAREEVLEHLRLLSSESRINAEPVAVVSNDPAAAIRAESAASSIALLGFQPPAEDATEAFFTGLGQLAVGVPRVMFVWNAGGVSLEG